MVTLRDHTELRSVTGELDVVRGLTESLRSQNHEAANRLHTVVSLIEMGRPEEAVDFATEELQVAQLLTDRVVGAVGDPVRRRAAARQDRGGRRARHRADARPATCRPGRPDVAPRDLVTVLGNLVDNALDAVTGRDVRRVAVRLEGDRRARARRRRRQRAGAHRRGPAAHVLERGWTTKASASDVGGRGVGLALVGQVARRYGGDVQIGTLRRSAAPSSP